MKEAIIGLIGVVTGGLIGFTGQLIASIDNSKRWKKEKEIEHLIIKRDGLEIKYDKCIAGFIEGLETNSYPPDVVLSVVNLLPKNLSDAYIKIHKEKPDNTENRLINILKLDYEMKKSLYEIDDEIKKVINK